MESLARGNKLSAAEALSNAEWFIVRQGRVLSADDALYLAELRLEVKNGF